MMTLVPSARLALLSPPRVEFQGSPGSRGSDIPLVQRLLLEVATRLDAVTTRLRSLRESLLRLQSMMNASNGGLPQEMVDAFNRQRSAHAQRIVRFWATIQEQLRAFGQPFSVVGVQAPLTSSQRAAIGLANQIGDVYRYADHFMQAIPPIRPATGVSPTGVYFQGYHAKPLVGGFGVAPAAVVAVGGAIAVKLAASIALIVVAFKAVDLLHELNTGAVAAEAEAERQRQVSEALQAELAQKQRILDQNVQMMRRAGATDQQIQELIQKGQAEIDRYARERAEDVEPRDPGLPWGWIIGGVLAVGAGAAWYFGKKQGLLR